MRTAFFFLVSIVLAIATDIARPKNHRYYDDSYELPLQSKRNSKEIQIEKNSEPASKELTRRKPKIEKRLNEENEFVSPWNFSKETDRVQFQVEGHKGPETYIFGFDTGHGNNRQYRLEERHQNGTVKGQYGYYDAKGKLRIVRYIARPFDGYTERHHESYT